MKTKPLIKRLFPLLLLLSIITILAPPARAQQPDVIGQYSIRVTPRDDGTLAIAYRFSKYCATTDFPADKPYLQVGVPNRHFDLVDWGPQSAPNSQTKVWVTSATALNGVNSQVQLNFNKQPLAGDCWDLNFTINQSQMAYAQGADEVSFQFTPGWFDFARISSLSITWDLPDDQSLVHKTDPAPAQTGKQAVWTTTNLAPNDKFTVTITYSKSAFPNLAAPAAPVSEPSPPSSTGGIDFSTLLCVLFLIIVFLLILLPRFFRSWASDGGYGSGLGPVFFGGFGAGRSSGGADGESSRSGGGGGGFAGRGSSCACACASCACACACAGGGRAGCTRKGFDISRLLRKGAATT